MDLAFEDEHHVLGRSTLLKQNVAGVGHKFLAMAGEPEAILGRQAVQRADVVDGGRDLFERSGSGRRGNVRGKHPGTSGAQIQDRGSRRGVFHSPAG